MEVKNKYVYDIQPIVSAYKVEEDKILDILKSLYADTTNGNDEFVNTNKCWIYAFNYALLRRYKALFPNEKKKLIRKYEKNNAEFLEKVETITHELR